MSNKRVWHRLSSLRRQRFVGRSDEISLFKSILSEKFLQIQILYIYGAGGVGKTTLLQEFSHICTQENTPVIYIDARNIECTPDSFLNAIKINANLSPFGFASRTPGATTGGTPATHWLLNAGNPRTALDSPRDNLLDTIAQCNSHYVILIDTYETLQPLEDWLLQMFLPQLPENALIVLAGRIAQNKAWRIDPGWQALSRTRKLRNFTELETGNYLTLRQIASLHHDSILNFTHGHPLALSLVADVFAQHDTQDYKFDLQSLAATDVVKTLLSQFVQEVPSALHRAALEVCALVRLTTETLLAEVLGLEDGYELFNWLRGLSFIESAIAGIFPHDITREAIAHPDFWEYFCTAAETPLLKQAYFTVGKRQYGVSGCDYRVMSSINSMMQLPEWILRHLRYCIWGRLSA
ncbi:MAG: ATP-binding protein [Tolypothrix carrinoi HA7290-LM1]|jgi:energy-coupling factor transporter ATP-binding protein EcfA2|nr:ATP-binding protein [Tolypothrix carrinoi HA7290-LM1]